MPQRNKKGRASALPATLARLIREPLSEWDRLCYAWETAKVEHDAHFERVFAPLEDQTSDYQHNLIGRMGSYSQANVAAATAASYIAIPRYEGEHERHKALYQALRTAERAMTLYPAPNAAALLYKLQANVTGGIALDEAETEAVLADAQRFLCSGEGR